MNCTKDVKIGKGAFGDVYDVTVGGNRVAVKKILLKNETVKEMAINEIEALCMCNHENIVRFQSYEYSPKEKSVFILMELCQGGTLEKWLATKNLKQRNGAQVQFWKQIVSAVQHIHYKGLIHRDLKPGNIFLSKDGEVKVGDFGLAAVIEETGFRQNMNCNMYGTHLYMAPEFSACARYDYKVDIYSLGLILFELFYHMENLNRVYMTLTNVRSNKFPNVFTQNFGKIVNNEFFDKMHYFKPFILAKTYSKNDFHRVPNASHSFRSPC